MGKGDVRDWPRIVHSVHHSINAGLLTIFTGLRIQTVDSHAAATRRLFCGMVRGSLYFVADRVTSHVMQQSQLVRIAMFGRKGGFKYLNFSALL